MELPNWGDSNEVHNIFSLRNKKSMHIWSENLVPVFNMEI